MKKLIAGIMLITAVIVNAGPIDSLLAAREFATDKVVYYECSGEFDVQLDKETDREDSFEFRYIPKIGITRLSINGIKIVTDQDEPVKSLPWPTEGQVRDVWIFANGINAAGGEAHYGYCHLDNPKPGDSIWITLQIGYRNVFVDYSIPAGVDPSTLSIRINGASTLFEYSQIQGGFSTWFNTAIPESSFEIISNGNVIDFGSLDYKGQILNQNDELIVNFDYPAGIERVDLTDYMQHRLNGLTLDGYTYNEDGEYVPSKLIWVTKRKDQTSIPIQINGTLEFQLEVWGLEGNGDLTLISAPKMYYPEWYGSYLYLETDHYTDVFIIFRNVTTEGLTFSVDFGGGKG